MSLPLGGSAMGMQRGLEIAGKVSGQWPFLGAVAAARAKQKIVQSCLQYGAKYTFKGCNDELAKSVQTRKASRSHTASFHLADAALLCRTSTTSLSHLNVLQIQTLLRRYLCLFRRLARSL